MSKRLYSADIKDGKIEYDDATGAKTQYKLIEGGYEMIITTKQPNGTVKTEVKTFYDPKPVTEEELAQQNASKKIIKNKIGRIEKLDKNTTMVTREIPGGYEEVYTTINEDGCKSVRTKTFYDAVQEEITDESNKVMQKTPRKKSLTTKASVDEVDETRKMQVVDLNRKANVIKRFDSEEVDEKSRMQKTETNKKTTMQRVDSKEYKMKHESTFEETRHHSQKMEVSGTNTSIRKSSIQEQNIKEISATTLDSKKDTKKTKKNKFIPPPPPDFIENDTTTVSATKIVGGVEYTYTTTLDSGKTITTKKTVYQEEQIDMSEEEISQYKKTLKDAEKHKNATNTKKLKSQSGTKKIVPSENPGDVTTVETIKIEGGTEYHYTTVTSEGIVKNAVKTIYDPVPTNVNPDDTDEEEIIEEYEEEIIEPGDKIVKTVDYVKSLPKHFEEEVTITKEKKEKKVKKTSMMITN